MEKVNGLHLLYKNLGESPLDCIKRFKNDNPGLENLPMTYAGRLDPMAEGLLIVLSGEEVLKKDAYLDLPKTYEFEVLWGFETDTLDVLGKVLKLESCEVESEEIKKVLNKSIGKFEQSYPAFSSKPVKGKPLFQWAREGRLSEVETPKHTVEVFEAEFISRREISKKDLLISIEEKISKVSGDFRQKEILEAWRNELSKLSKTVFDIFTIDAISMTVSSGFYIRQFVSDLGGILRTPALTFHIKRVSVGKHRIEDIF